MLKFGFVAMLLMQSYAFFLFPFLFSFIVLRCCLKIDFHLFVFMSICYRGLLYIHRPHLPEVRAWRKSILPPHGALRAYTVFLTAEPR